jgi:hypothetical protein
LGLDINDSGSRGGILGHGKPIVFDTLKVSTIAANAQTYKSIGYRLGYFCCNPDKGQGYPACTL